MIRSLSVEIVKPSNCSWEQAGNALRLISKACTSGANLAQTFLIEADRAAYDSVKWDNNNLSLPRNGKKLAIPHLGEKATEAQSISYENFRRKFDFVSSRIASFVAKQVVASYKNARFDILLGKRSVPSYRNFPIMTDVCSIRKQDNNIILRITLLSTASEINCPRQVDFILLSHKFNGLYKQIFEEIIEGKRTLPTVKLVYLKNKKKWIVHIPFEIEAPTERNFTAGRILSVYPDNGVFLRCSTKVGNDEWKKDIEYESMNHTRNIYHHRMKALGFKYSQDSTTCSVGRGRKRALKNREKFQDNYKNACTTFNQQRAAFIVQLAENWKCESINYISPGESQMVKPVFDSWPWYQLEKCIRDKAEQKGIVFIKQKTELQIEKLEQLVEAHSG